MLQKDTNMTYRHGRKHHGNEWVPFPISLVSGHPYIDLAASYPLTYWNNHWNSVSNTRVKNLLLFAAQKEAVLLVFNLYWNNYFFEKESSVQVQKQIKVREST